MTSNTNVCPICGNKKQARSMRCATCANAQRTLLTNIAIQAYGRERVIPHAPGGPPLSTGSARAYTLLIAASIRGDAHDTETYRREYLIRRAIDWGLS